jgi:hypothetical protein
VRGIPTFPPPRRLRDINQTGHFTCYEKRTFSLAKNTGITTAELDGSQAESGKNRVQTGEKPGTSMISKSQEETEVSWRLEE